MIIHDSSLKELMVIHIILGIRGYLRTKEGHFKAIPLPINHPSMSKYLNSLINFIQKIIK